MTIFSTLRTSIFAATLAGCGVDVSPSFERPKVLPELPTPTPITRTPLPTTPTSPATRINCTTPTDIFVPNRPETACIANEGMRCVSVMADVQNRDPFYRDHALAQRELMRRYPVFSSTGSYLTTGALQATGYRPVVGDVVTFQEVGLAQGAYLVVAFNDPNEYHRDGMNYSHPGSLVWYRLSTPRPRDQANQVYGGSLIQVDWPSESGAFLFGAMPTVPLSPVDGTSDSLFQNATSWGNACTSVRTILGMTFTESTDAAGRPVGRLNITGVSPIQDGHSAIGAFAVGAFEFVQRPEGFLFVQQVPAGVDLCVSR